MNKSTHRAATWLPFLFATPCAALFAALFAAPIAALFAALFVALLSCAGAPLHAQTTGLPAPVSGDCVSSSAGALTCTKTNGTPFAPSASTDTTNAANITSGTLPATRLPAIPATAVTGLATSATTDSTNAANISSGTLPAARLPAIPSTAVTGLAPSATTDTTNAANITSGVLAPVRHPVTVAQAYHAFGDSITCGYTLANGSCPSGSGVTTPSPSAYPQLLQARTGIAASDFGITSEQACEVFANQIYPANKGNGEAWTLGQSPLYSVAIGTNDADVKGTGAYEATFLTCHQALLAWLGVPVDAKLLPGAAAINATGGYTNAANAGYLGGMYGGTTSGTLTATISTSGNPVYVWYYLNDAAPANAYFTVSMDGGAASAGYYTKAATPIATQLGSGVGVGVVRVTGIPAGTHTVSINQPNGSTAILGFGTNPALATYGKPTVLVSDIPNINLAACPSGCASVATQQQYTADIAANVAMMQADGIDARTVNTRGTMLGTAAEMYTDGLHPTALGHAHLLQAYLQAAQVVPTQPNVAATLASPPAIGNTLAAPSVGTQVLNLPPASTSATNGVNFGDLQCFRSGTTQLTCQGGGSGASTWFIFKATGAAAADYGLLQLQNYAGGTSSWIVTNASNPTSGLYAPNQLYFSSSAGLTSGFTLNTETAAPIVFGYNSVEKMRLQNGVAVGSTADPGPGAVGLRHLVGQSAAPTAVAGTAASACTVTGTDLGFTLGVTTGSAPASGTLCTVTFGGAYGAAPRFAAPGATNAASAAAVTSVFANSSTTALTVSAGTALAASASYAWNFIVVQ